VGWGGVRRSGRSRSEPLAPRRSHGFGCPGQGPLRGASAPDLPQYSATREAELSAAAIAQTAKAPAEIEACLDAAYVDLPRPSGIVGYIAGQPIPGEPPDLGEGDKRKLPPPPTPEQGGASPCWQPPEA
jgi:hypothetical protein